MERSDFLKELHKSSKDIKSMFSERGQEWLTNVVVGKKNGGKELSIDRIYELLCYFSLLKDLSKKVSVEHIEGEGGLGYRLPYSPGKKKNFSFFRFQHEDCIYDLCIGTGIPNKYDTGEEHPDISLQLKEKDDMSLEPGKLKGIWDAKYHKEEISKVDTDQMHAWLDKLKIDHFLQNDVLSELLPKSFRVYAVITNVPSNKIKKMYRPWFLDNGFSVVYNYQGDASGVGPNPSFDEHVKHNRSKK